MRKFVRVLPLILIAALLVACQKGRTDKNEKKVNILVNQDRWGEVAPCG